ncbi:class II fructose-bisphosphate aldolase, partial [Staphylococcus aureus]
KEMEENGLPTSLPLVIHGGTVIPTKDIQKAIPFSTGKINIDTKDKSASANSVRDVLKNDKKVYDPRKYLGPARETIKETIKGKIKECGTS